MLATRMRTCRDAGARNIWRLPERLRPVPVVALVDEVAELFLMADKSEKDQVSRTATGLLRIAQLGRAFGVYLIVCGQRIGADLGPGVTAGWPGIRSTRCGGSSPSLPRRLTGGSSPTRARPASC